MDKYYEVHGRDEASFQLDSTHRLPTVSAADALDDLDEPQLGFISTGISDLDAALSSSVSTSTAQDADDVPPKMAVGGLPRGQVTEIWGPPASGKTSFGIQLSANAISQGHHVVWVDCSYIVSGQRLTVAIHAAQNAGQPGSESDETSDSSTDSFTHYFCPSLAHLIALICRPTASTLSAKTAVVVVDSFSALINHAYPKTGMDNKGRPPFSKGPGLSARRLQTLQQTMSALQKLAATRHCAVAVLSQCVTKMQADNGACLTPSINASVWEQGISTRLVLFRDWIWNEKEAEGPSSASRQSKPSTVCFAGVQKVQGRPGPDAIQAAAAFRILSTGLIGVQCDASQASIVLSATPRGGKRKLGETGLEVPDSDEDDEDYGWGQEDDAAAPVPPQTQGSEDLILGVLPDEEEEDEDEEDFRNDDGLDPEHQSDDRSGSEDGYVGGGGNNDNDSELPSRPGWQATREYSLLDNGT